MTKFISRTFLKGLAVVLPIAAAVYVISWLVRDTESSVKDLVLHVLPENFYFPGLGFALVLVATFLLGLLMYPWLTRRLLDGTDTVLRKIPLFATIYSPVRDLLDMLGGDMTERLGQVVMVKVPNTEMETLGFVTRDDLSGLPDGFAKEDHVVVFVQWSSQIGGYCFIVPRDSVRPVDMTVEEGCGGPLRPAFPGPTRSGPTTRQSVTTANLPHESVKLSISTAPW